ncbi:MAG: LysE family transporter [Rhodospirillaceae bacterium]|nr:LysE family transporter [Rhodospirillaceae bacterium]
MEFAVLVLKSVLTGFLVAVPLGPIAAICLRRALAGQWGTGLVTGLGAATGDVMLASVAVFALGLVQDILRRIDVYFSIFGGLFLIFLGIHMYLRPPPHLPARHPGEGIHHIPRPREIAEVSRAYLSGIVLTLINPAPLFAFIGIFAGLRIFSQYELGATSATAIMYSLVVIGGIFVGSSLWWLTLAAGSAAIRGWMSNRLIDRVNKGLGLLVAGFGVIAFAELIWA